MNLDSVYTIIAPVADMEADSPTLVKWDSPLPLREIVETFARYFQREMKFDFTQYESTEHPLDEWGFVKYEAYLFHEVANDLWSFDAPHVKRFVGGCCFRWREWEDAPHSWALDWVWFHPFFRRRGHLSRAWSSFASRYNDFHLERPWSVAFVHFIEKQRNHI